MSDLINKLPKGLFCKECVYKKHIKTLNEIIVMCSLYKEQLKEYVDHNEQLEYFKVRKCLDYIETNDPAHYLGIMIEQYPSR